MSALIILINIVPEVPVSEIKWGVRKKKYIQIRKEEIKLCLFADDMIVYVENPTGSETDEKKNNPKLLVLISEFSKSTENISM